MAKIPITLKIAGSSYPFPEIEAAEEEIYRRAEREVNRLFTENAHPSLMPKDRLALAALELAMENARMKVSGSLDEDVERLAEVDRQIKEYLQTTATK